MFANTLTVTIDGVAAILVRVNQDNFGSTYRLKDATQETNLRFTNGTDKASPEPLDRHTMYLERRIYATPTATEKFYSFSSTFRMRGSSDPAVLDKVVTGAITLLSAQKTGMVGGES